MIERRAKVDVTDADAIAATRQWIERAVIGLNLCPFAKLPFSRGAIRYAVSAARCNEQLAADLREELLTLVDADPLECETSLLIHPQIFHDFLDYNEFLGTAEAMLGELELDGVIQIASFHPDYRFAGTTNDAPENNSNRSPFPTLHLLRESSVDRAVESGVDVNAIPEENIKRLRRLGSEGWRRLWINESEM
ncbi:MAG: DUF1415 domain-containing protein [Dokdonella sp.]